MTTNQALLNQVAEECLEVAQRISKANRFGLEESQLAGCDTPHGTNRDRIHQELVDLYAAIEMCVDKGLLRSDVLFVAPACEGRARAAMKAKKAKIEKYLAYSRQQGMVRD